MSRTVVASACLAVAFAGGTQAGVSFSVSFDGSTGAMGSSVSALESHILAAGAIWSQHLQGDASIEIVVRTGATRVSGRSLTAASVGTRNGYAIYEQGMTHEIRTGIDPNGFSADVEISVNPAYINNQLWFSDDPFTRDTAPPGSRIDAVSVFLHEIGHALGFNGWRDLYTGALPGLYMSTFDEFVVMDGGFPFFVGEQAMEVYGGPVALTYGNLYHLGNFSPRPGQDLIEDLMTGVVFLPGMLYDISELDLAMLADIGVPILMPAPSAVGLLALSGLAIARRRR